jgi:hypothetical protein
MSLSDADEDRTNAIMRSEEAMTRVIERFIKPYEAYLGVSGTDGVSQVWDDAGEQLVRLPFPPGLPGDKGSG